MLGSGAFFSFFLAGIKERVGGKTVCPRLRLPQCSKANDGQRLHGGGFDAGPNAYAPEVAGHPVYPEDERS